MARIQTGKSIYLSNSQWKALNQWFCSEIRIIKSSSNHPEEEALSSALLKLKQMSEEVANQ